MNNLTQFASEARKIYNDKSIDQYLLKIKENIQSWVNRIQIKNPDDVFKYFLETQDNKQECFSIICLNSSHEIIAIKNVTTGLVNRTIVHPREIFRFAIESNSIAIMAIHNHPSGNLDFSDQDIEVMKRLINSGSRELLGIPVLDFLIYSKIGFKSAAESKEYYNLF